MTWTTGEPVTWMYTPRGGYGYVLPIAATVVRETPKGVRIAAIDKAGKVRFRNVKPKNLRRVTDSAPAEPRTGKCGFCLGYYDITPEPRKCCDKGARYDQEQRAAHSAPVAYTRADGVLPRAVQSARGDDAGTICGGV